METKGLFLLMPWTTFVFNQVFLVYGQIEYFAGIRLTN